MVKSNQIIKPTPIQRRILRFPKTLFRAFTNVYNDNQVAHPYGRYTDFSIVNHMRQRPPCLHVLDARCVQGMKKFITASSKFRTADELCCCTSGRQPRTKVDTNSRGPKGESRLSASPSQ